MSSVSFSVKHYDRVMYFEVEHSGSLVSGQGPDDSVPDLEDQRGWLETDKGVFIRDFLPKEIEELLAEGTPCDDAMWLAIGEQQYEGGDYDYD